MDQLRLNITEDNLNIIEDNPIDTGLDSFHVSFASTCQSRGLSCSPGSLGHLGHNDLQDLTLDLLAALQGLRISRLLPSTGRGKNLLSDLTRLNSAANSDNFDFDRVRPLLDVTLAKSADGDIWEQVYIAVTESTPPPRPVASSLQQTPWLRNTSSFPNSSEYRKHVDDVLKEELGPMYIGLPHFYDTFFDDVADLKTASEAFFEQCIGGTDPFFEDGWRGWPPDARQDDVLTWFTGFCEELAAFAEGRENRPMRQPRLLAKPNELIDGSVGKRKMDIGFVSNPRAGKDTRCQWSQILVPGELKSNPAADKPSEAWLDLGRYAREVLAAQDTRRFVLGFTICGSLMRVWAFDRVGGIASEQFDINKDGHRFVFTILGFLWMSDRELGFDPTILTANKERFIEIKRNGSTERVIIDGVMLRARCIAGRATTCWRAHPDGREDIPLVIKDSWQYPERDEEGELLRDIVDKSVVNVARYYYHETVQIRNMDDDIRNNIRRGLDITTATNYRPGRPILSNVAADTVRTGRTNASINRKRPSSQTDAELPPSKRSCSVSPTKAISALPNRVHRRVILRDYGEPIYTASSRSALLAALEGCIEGHESLRKAGILHRDISINNLLINEDSDNPSWPSFLIDLDLAIREQRDVASGAKGKTGTRAFMAIGTLLGEQHSFMHDLESFFWVLFWICIHYDTKGRDMGPTEFDSWNYESDNKLVRSKVGTIGDESIFLKIATENYTPYYQPLIPWVNRLRRKVFPNGETWKRPEPELYSSMKEILRDARKNLEMPVDE
ncbi:uncharacterized protein BCR38DRAFT_350524 [Pseudomassariella vexata]|uniref:non-specific serine/threonine protein kinase n=1 Tax=Pseudomassariella vexata TaxID=1141098 RepID=A0A1Y2DLA9_9PEZI|nr:uncharacterized protein BCR38DRAFT_350524 [Pseudomassariella vexata]ORY59944.1 hypothetical protein BCR38DRAFT_350524 [Pseudomassariella vexata]